MQDVRQASVPHSRWSLSDPLLRFPELNKDNQQVGEHEWTIGHAFEGLQIFGGTGSGKTSGSGRTVALKMLEIGFGGLVLTAKPDEVQNWREYMADAGRSPSDLVVIEPNSGHRFNFLNSEYQDGGKFTPNLTTLFMQAVEAGGQQEGVENPYWSDTLRQLLLAAFDLVAQARGQVRLSDVTKVIRSAPLKRYSRQGTEEDKAALNAWESESLCAEMLAEAMATVSDPFKKRDLEETRDYWLSDFANLADRTRSVIVSMFTSKATGLLRSPIRDFLCSEEPDTPDASPTATHNGKVVVLNFPVKVFGEVGRFAQVLYKTVWQRATERRVKNQRNPWPVFLWADESQYFVTKEDMLFQQTARSSHAATVYLTQSLSNYYAMMNARNGHAVTDSLLGNLTTKIFHANGDPATNEWAERVFAKTWDKRSTTSMGSQGFSKSAAESIEPVVLAKYFAMLRRGGNIDGVVDGIVFQAGRKWGTLKSPALWTFFPASEKRLAPVNRDGHFRGPLRH